MENFIAMFTFAVVDSTTGVTQCHVSLPENKLEDAAAKVSLNLLKGEEARLSCVDAL